MSPSCSFRQFAYRRGTRVSTKITRLTLCLEVTTDKQDDAVHDSDLEYDGELDAPSEDDSDGEEGTLVA